LAREAPSLIIENSVTTPDIETFKDEFNSYMGNLDSAITNFGSQVDELRRQNEVLQGGISEAPVVQNGLVAQWLFNGGSADDSVGAHTERLTTVQ